MAWWWEEEEAIAGREGRLTSLNHHLLSTNVDDEIESDSIRVDRRGAEANKGEQSEKRNSMHPGITLRCVCRRRRARAMTNARSRTFGVR